MKGIFLSRTTVGSDRIGSNGMVFAHYPRLGGLTLVVDFSLCFVLCVYYVDVIRVQPCTG